MEAHSCIDWSKTSWVQTWVLAQGLQTLFPVLFPLNHFASLQIRARKGIVLDPRSKKKKNKTEIIFALEKGPLQAMGKPVICKTTSRGDRVSESLG